MERFDLCRDFGANVFHDRVMKERLPEETYRILKETIDNGRWLDSTIADTVAEAMKEWAMEHGATHFTHWFQPLTGITAEKHDSFLDIGKDGEPITKFSGKALVKGEPDASSFPSGGLRATFEARGYTTWDCTSPAFLKSDGTGGVTLCIPTAFCGYTGVALDKKTPLLRSEQALNKQVLRILRLFGDTETKKVMVTVGAEQEYFLINLDSYENRKDLIFTGRTLFGAKPPKGQEMDDHYFGVLKERVAAFMKEVDQELWRLGVYSKTKHNEAAPCQHELAPIFATVNIANDNNQVTMEVLKRTARKHGFQCLLHEKPFQGINGSGKHNNWGLSTNSGENLLEPGDAPIENLRFLVFLSAILEAIDDYADLLRASTASAGNDHRLGADEAPPSIISMFLGDDLEQILDAFASDKELSLTPSQMDLGVKVLPTLNQDTSDRNRTSPFAFTGNKFEFRMVGSNASIAGPNTVLNTIVAESLRHIADRLEQAPDFDAEVHQVIREIVKNHKRVIFNGNGYSDEWVKEAEKRGLPNLRTAVDAFPAFVRPEVIRVFGEHGVYTEEELNSRYEIKMEKYAKVIHIEALTMLEVAIREILPATLEQKQVLVDLVKSTREIGMDNGAEAALLSEYTELTTSLYHAISELESATLDAEEVSDVFQKARMFCDSVIPKMKTVRTYADRLEGLTDRSLWPFETYSDILFY